MPYTFNTNAIKTASIALPDKKLANERPMLDAIHIFDANESRFYEATDGHIAVRVKTKRPDDSDPIPEPGFTLKIQDSFLKDKSTPDQIETEEYKSDTLIVNNANYAFIKSNLTFPPNMDKLLDYSKIEPASQFSMFDPDLLKRAQKALGVKRLHRPLQNSESDPAFWIQDDILVVIMPYRI